MLEDCEFGTKFVKGCVDCAGTIRDGDALEENVPHPRCQVVAGVKEDTNIREPSPKEVAAPFTLVEHASLYPRSGDEIAGVCWVDGWFQVVLGVRDSLGNLPRA